MITREYFFRALIHGGMNKFVSGVNSRRSLMPEAYKVHKYILEYLSESLGVPKETIEITDFRRV